MVERGSASNVSLEPILAGGGIVTGLDTNAQKLAIVRRRRYPGEIGLPKGKVEIAKGETVVDAAEREVCEEIGQTVRATDFAGLTHYLVDGRPKVVFFYRMEVIDGGNGIDLGEIESVMWVTPEHAARALTHAEDRQLIAKVFSLRSPLRDVVRKKISGLIDRFWETPETDRLAAAVAETRVDLCKQAGEVGASVAENGQTAGPLRTGASAGPADTGALASARHYLSQAEQQLSVGKLHSSWDALQSAKRELLACDDGKAWRAAAALRQELEAGKMTEWRKKTIVEFLAKAEEQKSMKLDSRAWIIDAIRLRDESFQTTYFKIALRRYYLRSMTLLLTAFLVIFLALSWTGTFQRVLDVDPALVTAVIVFGILGAGVSVAQGFLWSDVTTKIPTAKAAAIVISVRPAIGAVAALAAMVLLHANIVSSGSPNRTLFLAIAITAGFSERFIVGAVDRLAQSKE